MWANRGGRRPSASIQRELARGVGQVVLAADDVRDLHQRVVDGGGELVGGRAVRAQDHEVLDRADRDADVAAGRVVDDDVLGRRAEAGSRRPRGTRGPRAPGARRARGRSASARTAGTGRTGRPRRAPRRTAARATPRPGGWCARSAGWSAPASVSSTRSTNSPPARRANRKFATAVSALPRWSAPVGEGAKRTRTPATVAGYGGGWTVAAGGRWNRGPDHRRRVTVAPPTKPHTR